MELRQSVAVYFDVKKIFACDQREFFVIHNISDIEQVQKVQFLAIS
jgi:hypothetical protein